MIFARTGVERVKSTIVGSNFKTALSNWWVKQTKDPSETLRWENNRRVKFYAQETVKVHFFGEWIIHKKMFTSLLGHQGSL